MSRLPTPGGDSGTWGQILNDFLGVSLASDGTLKDGTVGTTQLASTSVTGAKLANGAVDTTQLADNSVTTGKIATGTITNTNINASAAIDGTKVAAGSTSARGTLELATSGEVTTASDSSLAVSPSTLGHSEYGVEVVQIQVTSPTGSVLATGDGQAIFWIPAKLNGWNLIRAHACVTTVSSSGTPTIQIRNVTDSFDMLSTRITIDANENTSFTAATAPVIDTAHDDVATGDQIAIDVDVAGSNTKGLTVLLSFQVP